MSRRGGWRNRRGGLEASRDRLSADRLAEIVTSLGSTSSESATMQILRGASRQTSVAAPSPAPSALGEKRGKSKPVVPAPTVTKPTVSKPWAWTTGRYRRQPPPKLVVRGLALTSHRLASGAARHRGIWFLSSRSTGHGFGSWRGRPDGCISGGAQLPAEEARRVCHRMPRPGPGLRNPRRFLYDGCPGIRAGGTGAVKRSAGIENPPFSFPWFVASLLIGSLPSASGSMQLLHPQRCPIVALRRVGAHDRRNLGRAASSVRSDSWLRPPCISGGIRYPG